jgi:hypothetical protein
LNPAGSDELGVVVVVVRRIVVDVVLDDVVLDDVVLDDVVLDAELVAGDTTGAYT